MRRQRIPHPTKVSIVVTLPSWLHFASLCLLGLVVLALPGDLAWAAEADDDLHALLELVLDGPEWDDDADRKPEPSWDGPWLNEGDEEAADGWVRRLRAEPWRVSVLAYAFEHLPETLSGSQATASPLVGEAERAVLEAAIRRGDLRLVRGAHAEGRLGDVLHGEDRDERRLPLRRDIESSIGAVVTFPKVFGVRSGLTLRATLLPAAIGGATVRYRMALVGPTATQTVETIGGELDEVSASVFLAQGTTRLSGGEVQTILDRRADGSGHLLLLSLRGPTARPEPVVDLGGGLVSVLAEHLGREERRIAADMPGAFWLWIEDDDDASPRYEEVWDAFAWQAGARLGEVVWDDGPLGLWFGVVKPAIRERMARQLGPGARLRRTPTRLALTCPHGDHLHLPVCRGTSFAFYQGRLETEKRSIGVESGCHTCVRAVAHHETVGRGVRGAGFACVDGTLDVRLEARTVLDETQRAFAMRRVLPGYQAYDHDAVTLPLVKDRIIRLDCSLPSGDGHLPGGYRLDYRVPAVAGAKHIGNLIPENTVPTGGGGCLFSGEPEPWETTDLIRVRLNGEPLALRPHATGTLLDVVRHPFIRRWESEGWCGMIARYPALSGLEWPIPGVPEGSLLSIRAYREEGVLLVDAWGTLRGAPEDRGPFDPGDGEVSIVRSPTLRFEAYALPLGRGRMVARGAGLRCRIEPLAYTITRRPFVEIRARSATGEPAELRTGPATEGVLEAGGEWLLPVATDSYVSGHGMGEVTTSFAYVQDGVVLAIDRKASEPKVTLRLLSRPALRPYIVRPVVEPPLPIPTLRLLDPGQREATRTLFLDVHGEAEHADPDPSFPYALEVRHIRPGPEGASR